MICQDCQDEIKTVFFFLSSVSYTITIFKTALPLILP